jgi:hypothetical protein
MSRVFYIWSEGVVSRDSAAHRLYQTGLTPQRYAARFYEYHVIMIVSACQPARPLSCRWAAGVHKEYNPIG